MQGIRRRDVLGGTAAAALTGFAVAAVVAQDVRERSPTRPSAATSEFLALSCFLTGRRTLDPAVAARAYAALSGEDLGFPALASRLAAAVRGGALPAMTAFAPFRTAHPDLARTATAIISAWYLGYTGRPAGESTRDDARFVSYEGALMYQPTIDATVIPTFSRGHTNYWAAPPATIATD